MVYALWRSADSTVYTKSFSGWLSFFFLLFRRIYYTALECDEFLLLARSRVRHDGNRRRSAINKLQRFVIFNTDGNNYWWSIDQLCAQSSQKIPFAQTNTSKWNENRVTSAIGENLVETNFLLIIIFLLRFTRHFVLFKKRKRIDWLNIYYVPLLLYHSIRLKCVKNA